MCATDARARAPARRLASELFAFLLKGEGEGVAGGRLAYARALSAEADQVQSVQNLQIAFWTNANSINANNPPGPPIVYKIAKLLKILISKRANASPLFPANVNLLTNRESPARPEPI